MNWYSIFYWVAIADGVKSTFDVFSNLFLFFSIVSFVFFCGMAFYSTTGDFKKETEEVKGSFRFWVKGFRRFFWYSFILMFITWTIWVFTPTKKDALFIIAGGAVGNFITKDSSAKQIPSEVMLLLRTKIKDEINDINTKNIIPNSDTLKAKTREELIEIIKNKIQ